MVGNSTPFKNSTTTVLRPTTAHRSINISSHWQPMTSVSEISDASGPPPECESPPTARPLPGPPDDAEKVTPDGGVLKHVLVEGSGEVVPRFARCLGGQLDVWGCLFCTLRHA